MSGIDTGRGEPTKITVKEWLNVWLNSVRGTVREGTWANYRSACRLHLVPLLGEYRLRNLRPAHIEAAYDALRQKGQSPKSVRNLHACLSAALSAAVRNDQIPTNPAARAYRLRVNRTEQRVWDADEVRRFLNAVMGTRLYALWRLAALTGARRGELLGLQWPDIDFLGRYITIQRTLSRQGEEGVILSEPKTPRSRRRVPIDERTVQALREHRQGQKIGSAQGFVFTRPDGHPLDPDVVSSEFRREASAAGLPPIRLHDLRHTAATLMLRSGAHPKVVAERLGHSSVAITLDLYSHAVPSMGEEAADRLAELVDNA